MILLAAASAPRRKPLHRAATTAATARGFRHRRRALRDLAALSRAHEKRATKRSSVELTAIGPEDIVS